MWSDKKVKSQNKHDKNSTRELHEDTKKRKKWLLLLLLLLLLIGGSTGLAVYFINRSHDKYIRIKTDINSIIIDDIDSTIINGNFDTNIEKVETLEFCGKDAAKFNSLNFNLLSKTFSAKLDNTTPIGEYQLQLQVNANANFMSNSVNINVNARTFSVTSTNPNMLEAIDKTLNINWSSSYFAPVTIELDTTDSDTNNFDLDGGASPIPGTSLILSRKNVNLAAGTYNVKFKAIDIDGNIINDSISINVNAWTFSVTCTDSNMLEAIDKTLSIDWSSSYFAPVTIELDTTDSDTNNFDLDGGASPIPGTSLILSRKNVNLAAGTYNVKFKATDVDGNIINDSISINVNARTFSVTCTDSIMEFNVAKTLNINWSSSYFAPVTIELDTTDSDTNNFDLDGGASPIPGTSLILSRKNVNLAAGTYNVKFKATDVDGNIINDSINIVINTLTININWRGSSSINFNSPLDRLEIDWSSPNDITKIELVQDDNGRCFNLYIGTSFTPPTPPTPGTPLGIIRNSLLSGAGVFTLQFKATDVYNRSIIKTLVITVTS